MQKIFSFLKANSLILSIFFIAVCALVGNAFGWTGPETPLIMFGLAEIKSMAAIKEKWIRVTPQRSEDYSKGIANPKRDWAAEAIAAKGNWKAGIDAAASKDMYSKGIAAAGSGKWKAKALALGPGRFAEGVYAGGDDYAKGFAPFQAAIAAVDLGPKFPRRDPRNLDRVKRVVMALVEAKVGK